MAIELGALSLAIRDQGGDALLGKLRQIDKQAAGVGRTPITLGVQSAGLTQATAGLTRLIAELSRATGVEALRSDALRTLVTMEADLAKRVNDTSLAMEQRVTIGSALQRVQKALNAATGEGVAASQQETAASRAATAAAEAEARAVNKLAAERAKERAILASPRAPAGSTASSAAELAAFRERIAVEARAAAASQMAARTPVATAQPAAALAQTRQRIAEVIADVQRMARAVDVADAKAVAAFRRDAAEALNYARAIKATAAEMATLGTAVASVGTRQQAATVASTRASAAMINQGMAAGVAGRKVVNAQGAIVGAGRASITALNAVAFSLSQFAATGEASFRSVATALSSFAAFMGPHGAIASIAITTGIALVDFFQRQKQELAALSDAAIAEARRAAREVQLAFRTGDRATLEQRAKDLEVGTTGKSGLADLRAEQAFLEKSIEQKRFDLFNAERVSTDRHRKAVQADIAAMTERRVQVVREIGDLQMQQRVLMQEILTAPVPRAEREPIKVTTTALKDQKDTLDQQIAALKTLADLRKVDIRALETAHGLLVQLTAESVKQGLSLEDQAKTLARINALKQTGLVLEAKSRSITPSIKPEGPARFLSLPFPTDNLGSELQEILKREYQSALDGLKNDAALGASASAALQNILAKVKLNPSIVLSPNFTLDIQNLTAAAKAVDAEFQTLGMNLANVLAGAIATGFSGGDVDKFILQALGGIFVQMGSALVTYGLAMVGLIPAFTNPLTAGPAAIAAGALLVALGGALGGAAQGKKGGGSTSRGLSSSSSISGRETISDPYWNRATLPVSARPSSARAAMAPAGQIVNVIGVNTPQGQRLIGESNAGFVRRGG